MTVGDIVFISIATLQEASVEITLDRPTVLIVLNEMLQDLYPIELMSDDTFWIKSATFTSGTTISYPSNYRETVAIEVPLAATGGARYVDHSEWQTVMNNSAITATADDPIYRMDAANFRIAPASAGTHYYIRTIPEVTSYSQDLFAYSTGTPQCMWTFQEALILGIAHKLTLREAARPNLAESEVKRMFDIAEQFKLQYDQAKKPLALFASNTMVPTLPPVPRSERSGN